MSGHLSESETEMLLELVERASEDLGNNGCNDFDLSKYVDSKDEINELVRQFHAWNGDPHEYDPKRDNKYGIPDFALISFLTKKALGLVPTK